MKKGFTLIELLAVIVILAFVSLITVPLINNTIKKSKESTSARQVESIEKAAESWFLKQRYSLDASGKYYLVMLETLLEEGYLNKKEVIDPAGKMGTENNKGEKVMNGCVKIDYKHNQYTYKYSETECSCSDNCTIIPEDSN